MSLVKLVGGQIMKANSLKMFSVFALLALLPGVSAEARSNSQTAMTAANAIATELGQEVDPAVVQEFSTGERQALQTMFQTASADGSVPHRVILYCAGGASGLTTAFVKVFANSSWSCVDGSGRFRAHLEAESSGSQSGVVLRATVIVADVPASGQFAGNYEGYDVGLSLLIGAHYAKFNRVASDEANSMYLFGAQAGVFASAVYSHVTLTE
jgi:hypothetical protein